MAIRDRIRHALRKSEASDAISQTSSNTSNSSNTTANTSQSSDTGASLQKSSSRLFGFGSREKELKANKTKTKTKEKKRRLHPSEKPLTAQNLRHQELLSHFTMTFGASDPEQIETLSFMGVSPCCTRRNSLSLDITSDESTPAGSSAASTL